jgi:hypothetical protein
VADKLFLHIQTENLDSVCIVQEVKKLIEKVLRSSVELDFIQFLKFEKERQAE